MVQWIGEIALIGVTAFIGFVICVSVERKTISQMIFVVAILLSLQSTIENLTPVFQRWSNRIDSFQYTLDRLDGKGEWEMPVKGEITQYYNSNNHGIDIAAPIGTVVRAPTEGEVKSIFNHDIYGLTVVIDHGNGLETLYAHNSEVLVKEGYPVIEGTKIALSGNSGKSTGPHLHFEIRKNGATVDPMDYVKN